MVLLVLVGGVTPVLGAKSATSSQPVSFYTEVVPILTKAGCNQGACHGAQYGKGGFKLSLLGYEPEDDYRAIVKAAEGRRLTPSQPGKSLLLLKPTMQVAHGGGLRFSKDSWEAGVLRAWIAQGAPIEGQPRQIRRIEVSPAERVLQPNAEQPLRVTAFFSDGTSEDATRKARFDSNDATVASVAPTGRVKAQNSGETAVMVRYLGQVTTSLITVPYPKRIAKSPDPRSWRVNCVDDHTYAKFKKLNVLPSDLSSDEEFLRRVYLDIIGTLPKPDEVRAFLSIQNPKSKIQNRERVIEDLLNRPEYVDFWTLYWSDVLRVNRDLIQEKGMWTFYGWIRRNVAQNRPFDEFARDILTAQGSCFTNGPANYFRISRTPEDLAETTAQVFLGIRIQCAKCHQHPFEKWSQNDYYGLASAFARVGSKAGEAQGDLVIHTNLNRAGAAHPKTGRIVPPKTLEGAPIQVASSDEDRRVPLAEWLTKTDLFAKNVVNRVWRHFMGVGLVEPADDVRASNPPSNPALMDALTKEFVEHDYDVKHLIRLICNSRTYQLGSKPNEYNRKEERHYSRFYIKRLTAEQLLDAIGDVTGSPDRFVGGLRAIQLPDNRINSYFLDVFGRPKRVINCECERAQEPNMAQALHLINGQPINQKIAAANARVDKLLKAGKSDSDIVEEFYLLTFGRFPTPTEKQNAVEQIAQSAVRREAVEDLLWALLNSREFLFNH
jgi:hypothetical protein